MRKFKPQFLPLFLFVIGSGLSLGILLIFIDPDLAFDLFDFLIILPFPLFAGALVVVLLSNFYSVEIDSGGLRAGNTWGFKRKVKWDEITMCRAFNFLGLRYVRLYGDRLRWGIWIPEFLSNEREFLNLVFEHSPSECPIKKHYESFNPNKANSADAKSRAAD